MASLATSDAMSTEDIPLLERNFFTRDIEMVRRLLVADRVMEMSRRMGTVEGSELEDMVISNGHVKPSIDQNIYSSNRGRRILYLSPPAEC